MSELPKNLDELHAYIDKVRKELDEQPKFIEIKWWQRFTHKHKTIRSGVVGFKVIERCSCGYGRINRGRWFKF